MTWIVEVDAIDTTGTTAAQTLICDSYDGTDAGAVRWAADVLDWCHVYVRSVRRCYGPLIEARDENRLDDPPHATPGRAEAV